jgi:hypothetical protein
VCFFYSLLSIDHIAFRSCCHYSNNESHQRNDIGTRETFQLSGTDQLKKFEEIASLHPYEISYYFYSLDSNHTRQETNAIWSRITSLRRFQIWSDCDPAYILATQTALTSLQTRAFSHHIQYCTKLLELTVALPSLSDYQYIPPSLTSLNLQLDYGVRWSFDDANIIAINNHLPHLSSLKLSIGSLQFLGVGALSPLSRWSSLTKLIITILVIGGEPPSIMLDGLRHIGSL